MFSVRKIAKLFGARKRTIEQLHKQLSKENDLRIRERAGNLAVQMGTKYVCAQPLRVQHPGKHETILSKWRRNAL
jgi:hypothetical protein